MESFDPWRDFKRYTRGLTYNQNENEINKLKNITSSVRKQNDRDNTNDMKRQRDWRGFIFKNDSDKNLHGKKVWALQQ